MGKSTPIIFMMLGVIVVALIIVQGVASYYGESDWTWIGTQVTSFMLIISTIGLALFTLKEWMR